MVSTLLPAARAANNAVARRASRHGFVLHEKGHHQYYWRGEGWLSIKSFCGGEAFYNAGPGHFAVDDDHYLVLNHGQPYSITIDSEAPIESFCVFFESRVAE